MERENVMIACAELNFENYSPSLKLEKFVDDIRQVVPEEYQDSIYLSFNTTRDDYDDEQVDVRIKYKRPETDEEMNSRIERELAWKRREEEVEAKKEKERKRLAAKEEEAEYASYLELHAKWGKKKGGG